MWWWDSNDRALRVRVMERPGLRLDARYGRGEGISRDTVTVRLTVRLPEDTPGDAKITVARSANG